MTFLRRLHSSPGFMALRFRLMSALLLAPLSVALGLAGGSGALAQDENANPPVPAPAESLFLEEETPPSEPSAPPSSPAPLPLNREAQKLEDLAEQQYSAGQFAEAQQTLEKLLAMQRRPEERAETLNLLGLVHDRQGQFDPAAASYQKALAAYTDLKASQPQVAKQGEARTLNNLGALYASVDRVNEALGFLERSLSIFRDLKGRESEAVTLRNLGSLYLRANRGNDAITALENSLQIETELNRPVQVVELLDRLSSLYLAAGAANEALVALQRAFTIVDASEDFSSKLALLTRMAQLYEGIQRSDKAIETYQQALDLVKKTPKDRLGEAAPRLEARLRDRIARVFADAGQTQRALAQYEKVLAIAKDLEDPLGQAQILTTMGDLQRRDSALDDARKNYTQALTLVQSLDRPVAEGRLLSGLAVIARDSGQWDEALALAQQALVAQEKPLGETGGAEERALQTAGKAITLNLLGDIYRHQKQYEPAAAAYQRSLAALTASQAEQSAQSNLLLRGTNLTHFGEMLLALGQAEEAVQPLQQAVDLWEAIGLESAAGQGRNPVSLSYQRLTDAFLAQQNEGEALRVVEQWRSRLYRTFLDLRQPTQAPPIESLSLQQIQQVAAEQEATLLVYDFADGFSDDPKAVDWEAETRSTQPLMPKQLRVWQLSPRGQITQQTVALSQAQQALVRSLQEKTSSAKGKVSDSDLQALASLFLEPVNGSLSKDVDATSGAAKRGDAKIVLVPPAELQTLPWAALPLGRKTLLDSHELAVVPNLQLLAPAPASPLDEDNRSTASAPLIIGNPSLPNAPSTAAVSEQVEAVAALLGVKALTEKDATLAAIAPQFSSAQLLHLAVPQFNIEGVGEALAFASNGELQGMTPADILALKLRAELVVLHGLAGNLDKSAPTELSLAQAFRAAGAPAVLTSTGQASAPATRDLMKAFYPGLQRGLSPAQALRQAMLKLRQQYPTATDWAGFALVGDGSPLELRPTEAEAGAVPPETEAVSPKEAAEPPSPAP